MFDAGGTCSRQPWLERELGREVGREMLIYRKLPHRKEMGRQEADTATWVQADKESLKEGFFGNHQDLEVKEKESDVNNNGGVPKQS